TFSTFTGILFPSSNQYYVLPTSTVPGLNTTLIAPTSHEIADGSEGHLLYDVTPRASLDLMGSYLAEHFKGIRSAQQGILSPNLLNTNGATAGASYQYRISPQLTMGVRYVFQYFHYGGGGSDQTQTGYLTAHWDVTEHAGLDLYAGPSYSIATGGLLPLTGTNQTFKDFTTLGPAFGGTFSFRSDDAVLNLSAQRSVSNGGGLLMTVMSDYEGAELRRRISDTWDIVATAGYTRSVAIQPGATKGKIDGQSFGTAVEHPILEKLSVHFEYDYLRQRVNNFVPLGTDLNTNQFSVALFYRIGEPKL
ncbi:MAG TPA: hypothetical protein VJX67_27840, partial [Blastocatellia bacterium]|nr:hypothetical protein [Blastocatellia bacterium]